jgi:carotenoid cleavage dioxygenase-like enzyme
LHNTNLNVGKLADQYVAFLEIPLPVRFDLKTLETLGALDYQDDLLKEKCWESAHPHYSIDRRETLNYLVEYGFKSYYTFHKMVDGSATRQIIAKIPVDEPSYMHTFSVTDNYIVVSEYPLIVNPLDMIISGRPFIKNYRWKPELGTVFRIIERSSGEQIKQFSAPAFFSFHHANAYENKGSLIVDIVCYQDASIIQILGEHFRKRSGDAKPEEHMTTELRRFTIPLKEGAIESELLFNEPAEFPRKNEAYNGKPYRYLYMTDPREYCTDADVRPIYKLDTQTRQVLKWSEKGCYPGEPLFIASPQLTDEDDGIVLTIVLDLRQISSFLLVLDGKTFKEVARATVSHQIPPGLHSQFFST